ncbi:hypothetical protein JM18_000850 [Phytophthora kernoviae]|uniref:Uncharacterized protein n=1 Tax=Phytophthora kernoviae TaxID=325452 RepID=A0A922ASP8_9STRA|nr:hypothetical protein JM18_000850 [Phytophthora kernoviae]
MDGMRTPLAQIPRDTRQQRTRYHPSYAGHVHEDHQRVRGFTVEQDPHFHDLTAVKFDESVLDRVIRRKLQLQSAHLVDLSDEFASTRVPSVMRAREEKQREHDRETMEEYLLEQMQHADSYNDGKLMIEAFRETIDALDLDSRVSPREVLLALATTDRDDMVDYGEFVSVAADMIDSMSGPAHGNNTAPNGETVMRIDDEDEALDAFEVVSARQTHYTVEKLSALLEAHAERVTTAANAMAARRAAAEIDAKQEATTTILEETNEGDNEDEDEADGEKVARDTSPDEMATDTEDGVNKSGLSRRESSATDRRTSSLQQQLHMPRYQLRTLLETPQLLLSQAEINLILALAQTKTDVNGVGEVLCEDLGSLLRRVRRMIFRFQRKGFVDRTEKYLLNQFQAFEKTNLQGSARHLKHRLTQKEVKAAVKKMQKLLISPYQLMQLLALSEEQTDAPEHIVHYQEFIPRMARRMEELVSLDILAEKSSLLHGMHVWDFSTTGLPNEDAVRQASFDSFVRFDLSQLGVIPIGDFRKALKQLAEQHDFPVGTLSEMKQLTVLADPNGSGRVNYAYFQHLMYPLMRLLLQERELATARDETRTQCG